MAKNVNTCTADKQPLVIGATKGKLVRFSYLNVHTPRASNNDDDDDEDKKLKYGVQLLIPKTNTEDIADIRAKVKAIQADGWTDNGKKVPLNFHNPLKDGDGAKDDGEPYSDECKGHFLLRTSTGSDYPPNVVGTTKSADGKFIKLGPRDIKSGDYGRVRVALSGYIVSGKSGVTAYLASVQLVRQGEPLGSQSSAENDFKDFEDEGDASMLE